MDNRRLFLAHVPLGCIRQCFSQPNYVKNICQTLLRVFAFSLPLSPPCYVATNDAMGKSASAMKVKSARSHTFMRCFASSFHRARYSRRFTGAGFVSTTTTTTICYDAADNRGEGQGKERRNDYTTIVYRLYSPPSHPTCVQGTQHGAAEVW